MQDETYGPGTDLAMALVGIFILYVAINMHDKSHKSDEQHSVQLRQEALVKQIADSYKASIETRLDKVDTAKLFIIKIDSNYKDNIIVKDKNSIQTISFGDNLLFDEGSADLLAQGQEVMARVGGVLKNATTDFEEIQIQGHADTKRPPPPYSSNLELASDRATTVYQYLQDNARLDPAANLISIVSFGEFKPVQRTDYSTNWNMDLINLANRTKEQRDMNRRIEILLIYR